MQSNRLVVMLDSNMEIKFESGIIKVYKNSYLVNDFVVRPSFLLGPTENLRVTFQNAESNPSIKLEPTLLAERKTTVTNSSKEIVDNDISQIAQSVNTGYEYYLQLPSAVLVNEGEWYFSLEIDEAPDSANPTVYSQISTSDIVSFTVFNSLAGANPNGSTPTELDIVSLYNTARAASEEAGQSAADAEISAQNAQQAASNVEKIIADATESITAQATEQATNATRQIIDNETERATQVEGILQKAIDEERNRAMVAEDNIRVSVANNNLIANNNILAVQRRVDTIESYIPSSTSEENQLADKAFVNSSINAMAAFYITSNAQGDAFPTKASLLSATTFYSGGKVRVPTQNDYATVLSDESQPKGPNDTYPTTRYTYQTDTQSGSYPDGQWELSFVVNATSFTQAQLNALNSGITSGDVDKLSGIEAGAEKNPTNYVTTDTDQNVTGKKQFKNSIEVVRYQNNLPNFNYAAKFQYDRIVYSLMGTNDSGFPSPQSYDLMFPAKNGTLALTSDIEAAIAAAITTALNTPV